jgi:hypothetical protein
MSQSRQFGSTNAYCALVTTLDHLTCSHRKCVRQLELTTSTGTSQNTTPHRARQERWLAVHRIASSAPAVTGGSHSVAPRAPSRRRGERGGGDGPPPPPSSRVAPRAPSRGRGEREGRGRDRAPSGKKKGCLTRPKRHGHEVKVTFCIQRGSIVGARGDT